MGAVLREVIIDCNDAGRVAEFWGEVLGWAAQEDDELFWMSAVSYTHLTLPTNREV